MWFFIVAKCLHRLVDSSLSGIHYLVCSGSTRRGYELARISRQPYFQPIICGSIGPCFQLQGRQPADRRVSEQQHGDKRRPYSQRWGDAPQNAAVNESE